MKEFIINYRLNNTTEFRPLVVHAYSLDNAYDKAFEWIDRVFNLKSEELKSQVELI